MRAFVAMFGGALGTSWASSGINPPVWAQLLAFAALSTLILGAIEYVEDAS